MNSRRGFTLIELLVTIVVMGILLAVGVIGLESSQANGRNNERATDASNIARYFENLYTTGASDPNASYNLPKGTYPSTNLIPPNSTIQSLQATFGTDLDTRSLQAPGITGNATSLRASTAGNLPQTISKDEYVYTPLTRAGTICTDATLSAGPCVSFTIQYQPENGGNAVGIKSKNQ